MLFLYTFFFLYAMFPLCAVIALIYALLYSYCMGDGSMIKKYSLDHVQLKKYILKNKSIIW